MSIITNFTLWWIEHEHQISIMASLLLMLSLIFLGFAWKTIFDQIMFLHDLEVQLTAHGVDWALYTPVP